MVFGQMSPVSLHPKKKFNIEDNENICASEKFLLNDSAAILCMFETLSPPIGFLGRGI